MGRYKTDGTLDNGTIESSTNNRVTFLKVHGSEDGDITK